MLSSNIDSYSSVLTCLVYRDVISDDDGDVIHILPSYLKKSSYLKKGRNIQEPESNLRKIEG